MDSEGYVLDFVHGSRHNGQVSLANRFVGSWAFVGVVQAAFGRVRRGVVGL